MDHRWCYDFGQLTGKPVMQALACLEILFCPSQKFNPSHYRARRISVYRGETGYGDDVCANLSTHKRRISHKARNRVEQCVNRYTFFPIVATLKWIEFPVSRSSAMIDKEGRGRRPDVGRRRAPVPRTGPFVARPPPPLPFTHPRRVGSKS